MVNKRFSLRECISTQLCCRPMHGPRNATVDCLQHCDCQNLPCPRSNAAQKARLFQR